MKPIVSILIMVLANLAIAAPPSAMDFSLGQPADYFTDDTANRVQVSAVDDTQVMVISETTARVHDLEVKPSAKYTLKLEAAFEGDVESIEENPRFEIFAR